MAFAVSTRTYALPGVASGVRLGAFRDVALVGGLLALAGLVRWPNHLLSPQFPSVGPTVMLALDVAAGRAYPLADQAPYLGAPFLYLLAAVYRVFGASIESTLAVPWLIGVLTLVPTYLLGRELGGRITGTLAAALLATSPAHTVISSHVPLSHSATPLLATTTLWLLARALLHGEGRSLALAGLSSGLSLQSHPTVLPLLAGAASGVIIKRPAWLRSGWLYAALGLALAGYGSLLVHHVQTRFEIVTDIAAKQERYLDADDDADEIAGSGVYLNNLDQLVLSVSRLTAGLITEEASRTDYLRDPRLALYTALALGGVLLSARAGQPFLLIAIVPAILAPPLLSGKYRPILDGRYLMPLVPVAFVGVGLFVGWVARNRLTWRLRGTALGLLAVTTILLILAPLTLLDRFYRDTLEDGNSNAVYLQTLEQVQAARIDDEPVLVDPLLRTVKNVGGGKASANLEWLLAVSDIPFGPFETGAAPPPSTGRLAILHRTTAATLSNTLELVPLDGRRIVNRDRLSYRAYRVLPR
ncbi:MAG: glycosyltransferase family 39 protein [Chloroflexota bacterium]